ncbi:MAG: N-acetyl sugar amidotransferase [Candidatus Omnitrophica bacterium]|nr:N-acetyl sugar amidotransferase [Candidatus Omnitrophota bacterium]
MDWRVKVLPKEIKFCARCAISNQRPGIVFDENNVCAPCNFAEKKKKLIDWASRKKEFEKMLEGYRRNDGNFDVIVPSSGGKDSAVVAHRLKHEYGMHPLCVTWAPMIYTDIGWQNLQNFIASGFPTVLMFPDRILHRKLSKLAFVKIGAHFYAFGRGQMAAPFHVAIEKGIKLVMYAQNGESEYGGITKYDNQCGVSWADWERFYHAGLTLDNTLKVGVQEGFLTEEEMKDPCFKLYTIPSAKILSENDIAMHWFFYYHKDVPQENYYYVSQHTGFQANPERSEGTYTKFASLDDRTDGFHYYLGFIKYGIGRATSDAAHEVRDGFISREEAVALIRKYDGEFPKKYYKEFLEYVDLTDEEFRDVVDAYRQEHIWKKENGEWKLRHQAS